MPVDLDDIETRLRSTLDAVAGQTVVDGEAPDRLPCVVPTEIAARRRPRRRGWLAMAAAAAALLVVAGVALTRPTDTEPDDVTTAGPPTPSSGPPYGVALTYVPDGMTLSAGNAVVPAGWPATYSGAAGTFQVSWTAQRFDGTIAPTDLAALGATAAEPVDGLDGLRFAVPAGGLDADVASLQKLLDEAKARYGKVFELGKSASPDQAAALQNEKDDLIKYAAQLQDEIALRQKGQRVVRGGRSDMTVTVAGTIPVDELRKVATGLEVLVQTPQTPGHPYATTVDRPIAELGAPTPAPTPGSTPEAVGPAVGGSAEDTLAPNPLPADRQPRFTAPLPPDIKLYGAHDTLAPYHTQFWSESTSWRVDFPDGARELWEYQFVPQSANGSTGPAGPQGAVMTVQELRDVAFDVGTVTMADGTHPTPRSTPNGLRVVGSSFGCKEPDRCIREYVVWDDHTVQHYLVWDPNIDMDAYLDQLRVTS